MEDAWRGVQKTDGSILFHHPPTPCLFFTFEIEVLQGLQNFTVTGEIVKLVATANWDDA